jgi:anti-sigma regulatory factor (Ser/Thr protein kinase)
MCTQTPAADAVFAPGVHAPADARHFLAGVICPSHNAGVLHDAELLVSELVTNAVRHGTPPIRLQVECDEGHDMVVRVTDANPEPPRRLRPDAADESGRGMELVDIVSDDWGVELLPDGKQVWFRLKT